MNLSLDTSISIKYHSKQQQVRMMSEDWVARELYCPKCGSPNVSHLPNNMPVADFECPVCASQYELKSQSSSWRNSVTDGAYDTLIARITSDTNPDWLFMSYRRTDYSVRQLFIVPKYFFTPQIVKKRAPLPPTAKRAGWVGCTLSLRQIPKQGRVAIVSDGVPLRRDEVFSTMRVAESLAVGNLNARGWLMDVLSCVNDIHEDDFLLADVYAFEERLQRLHPDNHNIRPKIRQQLQVLRDRGIIEFLGRGRYRKVHHI